MTEITDKRYKILFAAGVFPPDIGGPATYASELAIRLRQLGHQVVVLTFGDETGGEDLYYISRKQSSLKRYYKYFRLARRLSRDADLVYAFDLLSVGLPCALAKLFTGKKLLIRLGGDFQWEQAVQRGYAHDTLAGYYQKKHFNVWEKSIFRLTQFVIRQADHLIFNAYFLQKIYLASRVLLLTKTTVIKNIKPAPIGSAEQAKKISPRDSYRLLFAGRVIAIRNLDRLISAFGKLEQKQFAKKVQLEIVGDGPEKSKLEHLVKEQGMTDIIFSASKSHSALQAMIADSDAVVLPSLSDVAPNFVSEALALGKPVVLTKYSEFFEIGYHCDGLFYIDPLDEADMIDKITLVLRHAADIGPASVSPDCGDEPTWPIEEVVLKHLNLIQQLINNQA